MGLLFFYKCSRCGEFAVERLKTHSYCLECNDYRVCDEVVQLQIPPWALQALKKIGSREF